MANILWNKLHILPIETFTGKLDVFHASDWTQPPSSAFKVTTIHDLVPIIYPETTRKDILRNIVKVHLSRFRWVGKEVDRVIAVSLSTKADIVNYLEIPEEKIRVVHEAPDHAFSVKSITELDRVKRKYEIHGDYFLTVGTGPRKNLDRVIKAFEQLKPKISAKLVVACRGVVLESRGIVHISDSSNDELACLYTGAQALVYPSLYEGFGLPILEAFSCGCPVVTSNISSMPEVAGGAAILVDPRDPESIAEGIKQAVKGRDQLVKKGFARAKDFSWEKCAKETLEVYEESLK
jgi:glycosyltransferase involved in cell wall biosynthesis